MSNENVQKLKMLLMKEIIKEQQKKQASGKSVALTNYYEGQVVALQYALNLVELYEVIDNEGEK